MHTSETNDSTRIYMQRVHAVMDYIESDLSQDLTLAKLAAVAQFSPYHFHRIFLGLTGETVHAFSKRVRIERAAGLLLRHRNKQVIEIAFACGFVTASSFARSFKEQYGMTPTAWRNGKNPVRASSSTFQGAAPSYHILQAAQEWVVTNPNGDSVTVQIERKPKSEVAYVRYIGPFQGNGQVFADLFSRLYEWAEPKGFLHAEAQVFVVSHDNPELTDDAKLRVSACVEVPKSTEVAGEIGRMQLTAGGLYAVGSFRLRTDQYASAWNMMWSGWLPGSGYEPDDGYAFEQYLQPLAANGDSEVNLCIPIRPLSKSG